MFKTGMHFLECKEWNAKPAVDKTWTNFKSHFSDVQQLQRMQQQTLQGETGHGAHHISEMETENFRDTSEALVNLATSTAADRSTFATMSDTLAQLAQQLQQK